uniref:Major facilitator superfamily (MFS) profile domain-containing protein n=1 Tax=Strigamia maritima TaxID=126957 RepID=T1J6Z1_STRMM
MNNKREETSITVHRNQAKNSDSEKTTNKIEKTSLKIKLATFIRQITVEPAVLLYCIAMTFNVITTQSLTIRKYCRVQMGYPEDICRNLTANKTLENQAETVATNYLFYKTLLENLPTIVLAIFIGAWSDKNGRKFLQIFPTITSGIGMIIMIFNAHYLTEMDFNYILLASVPYAIGGNILCMLTGAFSSIADITDTSQRVVRFAIVQTAFICGMPIGSSCGSLVLAKFGYVTVYSINLVMYIITLLYILIFVKETIHAPTAQTLRYAFVFRLSNVTENLASVYKKREHNGRFHIFLLLVIAAISFIPIYGSLLGLSLVLPVMTLRLHMPDLIIGITSAVCKVTNEFIIAISSHGWMMFAASSLTIFSGMNAAIIRTVLSKIVMRAEQGKITAVMGAVEAAMPAIGSIMFTQVYNMTRITLPGAIYIMSATLALIPAICFGWIYAQRRNLNRSSYSA